LYGVQNLETYLGRQSKRVCRRTTRDNRPYQWIQDIRGQCYARSHTLVY
jgi:hypothetical protein